MKLLLMSYECSPYRGSEWAVGWGRLLGAAKVGTVHVITSESNFKALQRAREEGLVPGNVQVHTPEVDPRLKKLEQKPGMFAYNYKAYRHWQRLAFSYAQRLHEQEQFDLVHQVNVCTFREPGLTWKLDAPFLWGPMGGTQNFPIRFLSFLTPAEALKEGLRGLGNWVALRRSNVRRAAKAAAAVLGANSTNQRDLAKVFGREIGLLLETGLHEVQDPDRSRFLNRLTMEESGLPAEPLQLLWSGELQTRKSLPILLRALKRLPGAVDWRLEVLGDGPMRAAWEMESRDLGLDHRVHFRGRLPFAEAVSAMRSADLFCFTSLRDTSGNVVLEALAAGVPVLCFDHQGAADMVTQECGVKLPVSRPAEAYAAWARAIESLAADAPALLDLSLGATVRAREFLWSENHDRVNELYRSLARERVRAAQRSREAPNEHSAELAFATKESLR